MKMIPVNEPKIGDLEFEYVMDALNSGWISSGGKYIDRFEKQFANFIGKKYAISVSNGTAAIETALHGMGVEKGDEVIMPSFTIISCAIAVVRLGAKPVLIDIDPVTWNMDPNLIEEKISKKTKVVMPVHIFGHPVDMDPILELQKKYNFLILEDTAESHGAEYKEKKCGSIGDCSTFSFYANKLITTGEGGMVLTDDIDIYKKCLSYKNLYFSIDERFRHDELGYNFRMTNLQAAIGCAQVERVDEIIDAKIRMGELYRDELDKIKGLRFQKVMDWAKSVYWMYSVELSPNSGLVADEARAILMQEGVETRPFFRGLHSQPALKKLGLFKGEKYPNTDYAYKYGFYLPSGMTLEDSDIKTVTDKLKKILKTF